MNPDGRGILARLDATDEEIAKAWGQALSTAFRAHKRAGVPVATWDDEDHCVILISAEDVVIPDHEESETVLSKIAR
jgi:hypothetical protein